MEENRAEGAFGGRGAAGGRGERPPRLGRILVVSGVLLVLTLAAVSLVADVRELGPLARGFDRRLLLPIFLLAPANYVFRFYKWTILLRRAGLRVPRRLSLTIFLAGLSMTVTPAKAGELLKAHYLKETLGVPYRTSAPVVVAERVLDSASVLVLAVAGAVTGVGKAAGLSTFRYGVWIVGASAVGLLAVVLLLRSDKGLTALRLAFSRLGGLGRRAAAPRCVRRGPGLAGRSGVDATGWSRRRGGHHPWLARPLRLPPRRGRRRRPW